MGKMVRGVQWFDWVDWGGFNIKNGGVEMGLGDWVWALEYLGWIRLWLGWVITKGPNGFVVVNHKDHFCNLPKPEGLKM